MTVIPRSAIQAVSARHGGYDWTRGRSVDVRDVRWYVSVLRSSTDPGGRAEADDLEALADRYETELAA